MECNEKVRFGHFLYWEKKQIYLNIRTTAVWALSFSVVHLLAVTLTDIKMTSYWARWRLTSTASRLFTQSFIQGADQKIHQSSASLAFVPGTGEFPAQRASSAENVSIWWRHHGMVVNKQYVIALLVYTLLTNNRNWLSLMIYWNQC